MRSVRLIVSRRGYFDKSSRVAVESCLSVIPIATRDRERLARSLLRVSVQLRRVFELCDENNATNRGYYKDHFDNISAM